MSKRSEMLSIKFSDDGRHMHTQVIGHMPRIVDCDAHPANVQRHCRNFGFRQITANVLAARKEQGWDSAECARRVNRKLDELAAGIVESERSPIRNWGDLIQAFAELKGLSMADVQSAQTPMEVWIKRATHPAVVAKILAYEMARAQNALDPDADDALAGLE